MVLAIETMPGRMDAVETALKAALPTRVIKRAFYRSYKDHKEDELKKGVVTLVSGQERDYNKGLGMVARDGWHRMILIGHLKASKDDPLEVEKLELALIEEIKSFVKAGIPGMSIDIESAQPSRQQESPFGWVVVYIDAGKPRTSLY